MANLILLSRERREESSRLSLSNGATSVLLSALVLAGSRLASCAREKELVVWLAEQDQTVLGLGMAGFALGELPWTREGFAAEKSFLLAVTLAARQGLGREALGFVPPEDRLQGALESFGRLVAALEAERVDWDAGRRWLEERGDPSQGVPPGFPACPRHGALLAWHGCLVCHDAPLPGS